MRRLRSNLLLAALAAVLAFVPLGAQNAAKRAIDLDDTLAIRSMTTTSLSLNGQWLSYRLSPLQGDSEVVLRATSGDKEMKFPVGENGGNAQFRTTRRGPPSRFR
jgi:hypothetical protein